MKKMISILIHPKRPTMDVGDRLTNCYDYHRCWRCCFPTICHASSRRWCPCLNSRPINFFFFLLLLLLSKQFNTLLIEIIDLLLIVVAEISNEIRLRVRRTRCVCVCVCFKIRRMIGPAHFCFPLAIIKKMNRLKRSLRSLISQTQVGSFGRFSRGVYVAAQPAVSALSLSLKRIYLFHREKNTLKNLHTNSKKQNKTKQNKTKESQSQNDDEWKQDKYMRRGERRRYVRTWRLTHHFPPPLPPPDFSTDLKDSIIVFRQRKNERISL